MEVNENIDLYAVFKRGKLIPIAFKWRKDKLIIDRINLSYEKKNGQFKETFYSVCVNDTFFKISVNEKDRTCKLHTVEA